MDLDGYEADLADFTLHETPFYETSDELSSSAYDLSMLRQHHHHHHHSSYNTHKSTMKSNDGLKKKRKCVTFLPNYVQVIFSAHLLHPTYYILSFIYTYILYLQLRAHILYSNCKRINYRFAFNVVNMRFNCIVVVPNIDFYYFNRQ